MFEQRIQKIIDANWGDKQVLIQSVVHEIHILQGALPAPAYLESIAHELEMNSVEQMELPDGSTFDGPIFLRQTARLVRLAINEEMEPTET